MATKRKYIPLRLSLYDDIDVGQSSGSHQPQPEATDDGDKQSENDGQKKRRENEVESPKCAADGAVSQLLSVCGIRKGEREEMQDAHVRDDQFELGIKEIQRCAFYCIFDGHAGGRAALYAAKLLPVKLKSKLSSCSDMVVLEKNVKKCFVDVYKQVDEQFLVEARKTRPSWKDGTTATTILVINDVIYCANIGDSKAIVCRSKADVDLETNIALQLTVDHSPLQFEERMRIQKAGGNVKNGRIMGILEVSRSIGDGQFKTYGLICMPDVKKFCITKEDRFMVIACDGLWKIFNNQEAIDFIVEKLKQPKKVVNEEVESTQMVWQRIADELAAESVKRGCGDNVSVIIVVFKDFE